MEEKWLKWAKEIQAIAQAGLAYTDNKYDIERYEMLREVAVDIMQHYTEAGKEKIRDLFCCEHGYQTPKVDVRAAIFKDDKILLVKESIDGCWSMPGGWADIGLSVRENIIKEAREEAGMAIEPFKLVGIYDWAKALDTPNPFAIYKIVMLCKPLSGGYIENIETEAADFFALDALPPLSYGRTTAELIQQCHTALNDSDYIPITE